MKIELPLDGKSRDRVRPMSRAVFKSDFYLELLAAIAQLDEFYATGLLELVPGATGSFVNGVLKRLADADLIESCGKQPGQLREYYHRHDSVLWDLVVTWLDSLLDDAGAVAHLTPVS